MKTFTDKIASYIDENQFDFSNLTIVLPSERARKYVASSLFNLYKKPILAPKMITMDAWIRENTERVIIDKTRALVKLYEVQLSSAKNDDDLSFDAFLEWGPLLLSDFDDIDKYLVDVKTIFKDLHNIKELEYWRIDADDQFQLSDARKRFLEFWDRLPILYEGFNKKLEVENATYMGKAYKRLSENCAILTGKNNKQQFLFAGFNALSAAETSIIKQLHKLGLAHVLVDADVFYVNDKNHEAGEFIRRQIKEFDLKNPPFIEDNLLHKSMTIDVVECAQTTGQIKVAATKLLELSENEINQTLLMLADESLIGPLLKNIPRKVGKANITLGMPMKGTAIKNWVEILFSFQESNARYNAKTYYHNDLKRLINHPFFISCFDEVEKKRVQELEENIIQKNWIFIQQKNIQLGEKLETIIQLVKNDWKKDWNVALKNIRALNTLLFSEFSKENQFERALIHSFDHALIEFQNIISEGMPEMSLRSFKSLFAQHWSNNGIAYHGNPVDGLQIMGMLETRLLDFKTIICIGMNEGTMPPTNPIQSLFPMDLRRYLGLPVPRDKQGLFAHHFYRLLHAAENVLITYSGTKESIGSNERSRYLLQLEKELVRRNPAIKWNFSFYHVPLEEDKHVDTFHVQKDEFIFKQMDQLFERSTSFSTLSKYNKCSLDFYYRYILEYGEEDAVEEDLVSSTFGTIVHATLEQLYTKHAKFDSDGNINPSGGVPIECKDIDQMLIQYKGIIFNEFKNQFNGDEKAFLTGKNFLSFQMANDMVEKFLIEERKFIEASNTLIIHSLEKKIKYPLKLTIRGENKTILLNGVIDRVDEVNGKLRLVDYKTGNCKDEDVRLGEESKRSPKTEMQLNLDKEKIFQLLMYCYLYYRTENKYPDTAGIFSMLRLKRGIIEMDLKNENIPNLILKFEDWLKELFENMYDETIPFEHIKKYSVNNYCLYCG